MSNEQYNSVEWFIARVERMRRAQKAYFETKSAKAYREAITLEKTVDAWLVARRLDEQKLAAWVGQKEN